MLQTESPTVRSIPSYWFSSGTSHSWLSPDISASSFFSLPTSSLTFSPLLQLKSSTSGLSWWLSGQESTCQCRRQVQTLVWEDPTCHGAVKPASHNYGACALEPGTRNCRAHVLQWLKPLHPRAHLPLRRPSTTTREWPLLAATRERPEQQRRPYTAKSKL